MRVALLSGDCTRHPEVGEGLSKETPFSLEHKCIELSTFLQGSVERQCSEDDSGLGFRVWGWRCS